MFWYTLVSSRLDISWYVMELIVSPSSDSYPTFSTSGIICNNLNWLKSKYSTSFSFSFNDLVFSEFIVDFISLLTFNRYDILIYYCIHHLDILAEYKPVDELIVIQKPKLKLNSQLVHLILVSINYIKIEYKKGLLYTCQLCLLVKAINLLMNDCKYRYIDKRLRRCGIGLCLSFNRY